MMIVILTLLLLSSEIRAHGGEDHGESAATATPVSSTGQLKLASYPGNLEVLVKYPAPVLNEAVKARIYFADYATNHPVDPDSLELSFPGAFGTKVTKQPSKISDGVYEFTMIFTRDTNHTALLKLRVGSDEQLTTLSPFFAGTAATRQLATAIPTHDDAEHANDEGSALSTWVILLILAAVSALAFAMLRNRRKRLAVVSTSTSSNSVTSTTVKTSDL